jgi:hypothetical protein
MLALAAAPAAKRRLFNGRDFTGWQHAGRGLWTVEDGAIVGRMDHSKPGPGYLLTRETFLDFRVSFEFWISAGGNSGVYVRESPRQWGFKGDERPAHGESAGHEIQIEYRGKVNPTGSIYNRQAPSKVVGAEERWNRMEIECAGSRLRVFVDGELVNDYGDARRQAGVFGFQVHGGKPHDHVVKFREVYLAPPG